MDKCVKLRTPAAMEDVDFFFYIMRGMISIIIVIMTDTGDE